MCIKYYDHWMCGWVVWLKMYIQISIVLVTWAFYPLTRWENLNQLSRSLHVCLGGYGCRWTKFVIFLPFYPFPPPHPPLKDRKMEFSKALKNIWGYSQI